MAERAPREIPPPEPPPARLLPDWPLPAYRYVPGLNPHPFRHPGGHQYTGGDAPTEQPWDPATPWRGDRRWLRGLDLLNHRYLWEAHEGLEALWHFAPRGGADAELLQGLIQLGAGALKRHMDEPRAAERLLERAGQRLQRAAGLAEAEGATHLRGLRTSRLQVLPVVDGWPLILPD